ncbi:synaptobrevin [Ophiostoma piceae UAMH 11346]|uniref:Synaptobrevin n=1 Tax=Ophiostoma piceae (strain UAMH 11346) TaxID=1262450 RepID=S3CAN7_OPHP1|nr:synaptobrevin [Ophiostoma piceae UAMH 11346]
MSRSNPYSLFTASPMSSPAPITSATFAPPTPTSIANSNSPSAYDPFLDLGRLLARLEQNLLRADTDRWRRLISDDFQRQQARFDVAAARRLLTRVEQSTLQIKKVTRRQEMQTELSRRRALIEQLQERLDDLDEEARSVSAMRAGGDDFEGDDETGEEDEELAYIQTPSRTTQTASQLPSQPRDLSKPRGAPKTTERSEAQAVSASYTSAADNTAAGSRVSSLSTGTAADKLKRRKAGRVRIETPAEEAAGNNNTDAPTTTRMVTRSRKAKEAGRRSAKDTARTSSAQVAGSPTTLFDKNKEASSVVAEETILDHHRREQEELSGDILRLAHALKEKSMATARMLEDDKEVVDRVGDGMNTTTDSLTAASKSMALLSRMTEGKGWWGRMMLMAMVYGLMLLLVLLFLFLPKLRL